MGTPLTQAAPLHALLYDSSVVPLVSFGGVPSPFLAPLGLFGATSGFLSGLLPALLTPCAQLFPGPLVGLPDNVGCLTLPRGPRYDYGQSPNRHRPAPQSPSHGSSFSSSRPFLFEHFFLKHALY